MPVYEYRCPKGHLFERFQSIAAPLPEGCEVCGEGPVTIVLYPVAVHFKGSGFYSTDYGRGGRKREGSKDGETSSSDGAGEGEAGAKREEKKKEERKEEKKAAEA